MVEGVLLLLCQLDQEGVDSIEPAASDVDLID